MRERYEILEIRDTQRSERQIDEREREREREREEIRETRSKRGRHGT